ncbi:MULTISPECIES: DUF7489 domain-containing protein [unclassified Rhodococcus (in: high G+C Gram-positive bacteria)]|uniref:DUF7489 domain-containing protein n=1 Tax=unclassified Rhodococcus (in: high G+C Gram-positive bacteria) TaxID=192944 RepID=UPI000B3D4440|nr:MULTISPECIES: hypothetical protein [unclassified Rhodococcus (in: high G+C Gram-positive bacteria)]KAF0959329.1 hypothetical protein MLGJGCBP_07603 [Rhodococcus sp. T7]OUS96831.1 hypothetical protein CA951_04200 [Rhodococcus sp. NCIMB 12038]
MKREDIWSGTVVKKSRGLLDGSNLYRRVTVRTDDDRTAKVRVNRTLWNELAVGDRVVKDAGQEPYRA